MAVAALAPVREAAAHRSGPRWLSRGRVPCLDGLRALALLLVLAAHAAKTHGFPFAEQLRSPLAEGGIGVDVFFVISGFLITLLLLREQQETGKIAIGSFYQRRCLRILPAYFAYLLVLAALSLLNLVSLGWTSWLAALTYTVNWLPSPPWEIGHLWSLSLEEHFYLLWPLLMCLGIRWARRFAVACLLIMPVGRLLLGTSGWGDLSADTCTLTRLDSIAAGCVLALATWQPGGRRLGAWATRSVRWLAPLTFLVLIMSILLSLRWYRFRLLLGYSVNAGAIAVLIWLCITRERSAIRRVLESRPLVALGTISYGFYVWQQLFLNPTNSSWMCRWPLNLALALLAAATSYVLVERPCLCWKERMRAKKLSRSLVPLLAGKET